MLVNVTLSCAFLGTLQVVDPETVPAPVKRERPSGKKTSTYCVRFFPKGDYAWLASKDISKLLPHEIQSYLSEPHKKSGDLLEGYKIALDPKEWEENMASAGEAEAEANAEVDQLDSEEEGSGDGEKKTKKAAGRKRKRESDAGPIAKTKAPKKPRKSKVADDDEEASVSAVAKGKKGGRKSTSKSKAMVESEDEGAGSPAGGRTGDDASASKNAVSPDAKKGVKKNEAEELDANLAQDPEAIKVRDWRHRLQKTFLSPKLLMPKSEEMPAMNILFSTIESYDAMSIQYLQFSKIGKVMRHIAALESERVPRDGEFAFRERAKALVDRWHLILNKSAPGGGPATPTHTTTAPTTNGVNGHVGDVSMADDAQPEAEAGSVEEKTAAIDLNAPEKTEEQDEPPVAEAAAEAPTTSQPDEEKDGEAEAEAEAEADADVPMAEA
ncbi:hypothetical protein ONZ45_g11592 [Pleurotus djamor]|nr:hypothetical protein ONZ45_g11592 [Pleurotus djamor]